MNDLPIGIFDSGVGGLSVLRRCEEVLPNEKFVYLFDRSHAPYGNKSDGKIKECALGCVRKLQKLNCKAIVIACNTASATAMATLRRKVKVPLIGVYPPVRQAVEYGGKGKTLVLCTAATARQKNFMFACSKAGKDRVIVAPQRLLAVEIEKNFERIEAVRPYLYSVLERYPSVSSVALGCTHYYYVKPFIEQFYCGKVKIFSPETGAANRLSRALAARKLESGARSGSVKIIFT